MSAPATGARAVGRNLWSVLAVPIVWALHLVVAYGGGAVACHSRVSAERLDASTSAHGFIVVVTIVAAVLVCALGARSSSLAHRSDDADPRDGSDLLIGGLGLGVAALALAAIVLEGVWAVSQAC